MQLSLKKKVQTRKTKKNVWRTTQRKLVVSEIINKLPLLVILSFSAITANHYRWRLAVLLLLCWNNSRGLFQVDEFVNGPWRVNVTSIRLQVKFHTWLNSSSNKNPKHLVLHSWKRIRHSTEVRLLQSLPCIICICLRSILSQSLASIIFPFTLFIRLR